MALGLKTRASSLSFLQELWICLRLVTLAFCALICLFSWALPVSGTSKFLCASFALIAFFIFPRWNGYRGTQSKLLWALGALGVVSFCSLFAVNLSAPPHSATAHLYLMPGFKEGRRINAALPEEDGIIIASSMLPWLRGITAREARDLPQSLEREYESLRREHGKFGTPLISTYLGLQDSTHFDFLLIQPALSRQDVALVFLHGFGGNWSLLCTIVARAAARHGLATACPSVGPLGNWTSEAGKQTLETSLSSLEAKGFRRFILAGLSAGAVGAGALAPHYQEKLLGVALLFGIHPNVLRSQLPTLVLYGTLDERFPSFFIERLLEQSPNKMQIRVVERLALDHFGLLKENLLVEEKFSAWIQSLSLPTDLHQRAPE